MKSDAKTNGKAKSKRTKAPAPEPAAAGPKTLAIDVGGTGIKATVLDERGEMITERQRLDTPQPCPPAALLGIVNELTKLLPAFDRVSVGFPGVVRKGVVRCAMNLGNEPWRHFDLQSALAAQLGKPAVVLNDADMQGLGAIKGDGVELVLTLGTGLGSAFFEDGRLAPHLELAHIPFRRGETYEQQLGNRALKKVGKKRWNKRLEKAVECFRTLTFFDKLYIGGGNAELVAVDKLGEDVELVSNTLGMLGGIWLWKDRDHSDGLQKS